MSNYWKISSFIFTSSNSSLKSIDEYTNNLAVCSLFVSIFLAINSLLILILLTQNMHPKPAFSIQFVREHLEHIGFCTENSTIRIYMRNIYRSMFMYIYRNIQFCSNSTICVPMVEFVVLLHGAFRFTVAQNKRYLNTISQFAVSFMTVRLVDSYFAMCSVL